MLNKKGYETLEESIGALKMLNHLEKECGGHGNGVVFIKDSKIVGFEKGLMLNNKKIAKMLKLIDFDYFIYHTRVASAGTVSNSNCHPYVNKAGDLVLCMNGTEAGLSSLGKYLDKTDTELIFDMINRKVIPLKALAAMSANYMGFKSGKVFVFNNSYSPLKAHIEDDNLIIASSFPRGAKLKTVEMEKDSWFQGEAFPVATIKRYIRSANTGVYRGDYYDYSDIYPNLALLEKGWSRVTEEEHLDAALEEEYNK
jgi:predicted glutamine amidotransferase